jgi:hypothetical protein
MKNLKVPVPREMCIVIEILYTVGILIYISGNSIGK